MPNTDIKVVGRLWWKVHL